MTIVPFLHPRNVTLISIISRLPRWLSGKESICQCRRRKRFWFNPWLRKNPWRRKWKPTPKFLPGKSHGQRSLVGYSSKCHRVGHNRAAKHNTYTEWINNKVSLCGTVISCDKS